MAYLKTVKNYLTRRLESTSLDYVGDLRVEKDVYIFTTKIDEDKNEIFEDSMFKVIEVDTEIGIYIKISVSKSLIDECIKKTIIL